MLPPCTVPYAAPPPAGVVVQPCAGRCPEPWPGRGRASVILHRPSAAGPAIGSAASLLSPPCSSTLPLLRGAVRAQGAPPICAPLRSPKPNAKKACDAISELAASLLPDNAWVELLRSSSARPPALRPPTCRSRRCSSSPGWRQLFAYCSRSFGSVSIRTTSPRRSWWLLPRRRPQDYHSLARWLAAVQVIRSTPVLCCTTAIRRNGAAIRTLGHY
ncbi:hypothetical protein ACP70R_002586 [Stipagrostis hirtigluma subsp. patula]